jgi:hypothetical protein
MDGAGDARAGMLRRLKEAARVDPRVVGVVDYGSGGEGRGDEWSDVDVALFIRDPDFDSFSGEWVAWAGQFGALLLAYVGGVGHPWAIYDVAPLPLRVDFAFHRESGMDVMLSWPNSPSSAGAFVLYDATGGRLTALAGKLVGQPLGPPDLARAFESVCGDFWYYQLRTLAKLRRGQVWAARFDFNFIITGNLHALLRIESGALERWRAQSSAVGIERAVAPARLKRLDECIPGADSSSLVRAFVKAAQLGYEVCEDVAARHGWPWPRQLAERTLALFREFESEEDRA